MSNVQQMIGTMFFLAAALSACAERDSLHGTNQPQVYSVAHWAPNTVKVSCSSGDCPEGVGVLVFVQDTEHGFRVQRCTGTAISEERVLANSHCGKSAPYNRSYFFLPVKGSTKRFELDKRVYDKEEGYDLESGMAEDLAIFTLKDPIDGVRPRKVARKIPANLNQLVAYVANEKGESRFQNFSIDKTNCTTVPRQVLFGGGTEDQNIGLSLFDCSVLHGNSGAPAFVPGNLDEVQVVINSSYPLAHPKSDSVVKTLMTFFTQPPQFVKVNFGMGNRVHCMNIEGLSQPEAVCPRAYLSENVRSQFEEGTSRIARERLNELNEDPYVAWGLRVFPVKVFTGRSADALPGKGMVLIPYPVCVRAQLPSREMHPQYNVQYLSVGLDREGKLTGRVQRTAVLRARLVRAPMKGGYEVMLSPDYRMDSSFESSTDNFVAEPDSAEARRMMSPDLPQKLGRCTERDISKLASGHLALQPEI